MFFSGDYSRWFHFNDLKFRIQAHNVIRVKFVEMAVILNSRRSSSFIVTTLEYRSYFMKEDEHCCIRLRPITCISHLSCFQTIIFNTILKPLTIMYINWNDYYEGQALIFVYEMDQFNRFNMADILITSRFIDFMLSRVCVQVITSSWTLSFFL